MKHLGRLAATAVAATLAGAALTGCSAFSTDADGTDGSGDGLRIAAAFYPLEYVAERVAGDLAEVEPISSNKDPHGAELSVRETAMIAEADLVLLEHGFQPSVDDAAEQNATGAVLDAADVVELRPRADSHDDDHGAGHEHTADDGHDHEGDLDPHFWQDPLLMADLGDAVAEELAEIAPEHAAEFEQGAAELRADLVQLDTEYAEALASCTQDTMVVSHDAFGYLTRYGLHFEPVAGLSPDAEPTPSDLARLQELIGEEQITTVFSERLVSTRLTDSLAQDLGLETAVLDPLEALTDETADEDYLSLMRANLATISEANGCR